MIIVDKDMLAQTDRSGRTKEELLRAFYSNGWLNYTQFRDEQDWATVRTFETNPEKSFIGDQLKLNDPKDIHPAKEKLLTWIVSERNDTPMQYYEFGVRHGASMKWVTGAHTNSESRFYGFDTFEGLPEDWIPFWGNNGIGGGATKGMMLAKQPEIGDTRVKLVRGLFQDTLPEFIAEHPPVPGPRRFINIDSDIYSAALYVLTYMHRYLRPGDLLYMDEFFDLLNEFAAFNDYTRSYYMKGKFKLLGRAYDGHLFEYTN